MSDPHIDLLHKTHKTKKRHSVLIAVFAIVAIVFFAPKVFDFSQSNLAMEDSVRAQRNLVSQGILAVSDIFTRDLDRGDKGTDVAHVQAILGERGYTSGNIDGVFKKYNRTPTPKKLGNPTKMVLPRY